MDALLLCHLCVSVDPDDAWYVRMISHHGPHFAIELVSWRNGSALVSGTRGCAFESHRDRSFLFAIRRL